MARNRRGVLVGVGIACAWAFIICGICGHARGAEQRPGEMKLVTERVVILKDGYCMIVKRGVGTTDTDKDMFTEEVPDSAVLGSFWAVAERATLKRSTRVGTDGFYEIDMA